MPVVTEFSYAHDIFTAPEQPDLLGLLRGLVHNQPISKPQRTWKGKGFNMIWRPNFGGQSGPNNFFLELNFTDETLEFTDITGSGIANRGLLQTDIELGAVTYIQSINDSFDNTGQHFEPGIWIGVPSTINPTEGASVTRMASIPHGTTVNLQGRAFTVPAPVFQVASIIPFELGLPGTLQDFPDRQLANPSQSRTALNRVAGLIQTHLDNPNLFLSDAIAGQTLLSTTVLSVTSDSSAAGSMPDVGGGNDNIAFLAGKGVPPGGGPNAITAQVDATFWIERVKGAGGYPDFDQLQYTQRVLLNFRGLSWPHITVATLIPV